MTNVNRVGVNDAWADKSGKPCMIIGVIAHARPWPADKYPRPGPADNERHIVPR
jgi:hypothetical protein